MGKNLHKLHYLTVEMIWLELHSLKKFIKAAGKSTSSSVEELATMVKEIGRTPAQRNTHFEILKKF